MDILIPMAGKGTRFSKEGYTKPKLFLDIEGQTMIDRVLQSIDIKGRIILILNGNDVSSSESIRDELQRIQAKWGNVEMIHSYRPLEGAAKTALEAKEILRCDSELIIAYCDQIMEWDSEDFFKV